MYLLSNMNLQNMFWEDNSLFVWFPSEDFVYSMSLHLAV